MPLELAAKGFVGLLAVPAFEVTPFELAAFELAAVGFPAVGFPAVKFPVLEFPNPGGATLTGANPGDVAGCPVTFVPEAGGANAFEFPLAVSDWRNELESTCEVAHSGAEELASELFGLGGRKAAIVLPICVISWSSSSPGP